jgi:transcriptional antiterminator RfaH
MGNQVTLAAVTMCHDAISPSASGSAPSWYVLCCKPRQESVAQENLQRQGFEAYLPRIMARRRKQNRWVDAIEMLFPRYLFVRVDRQRQSTASIRSTRGAVGLVRFGLEPAAVPDRVIEAIIAREDPATGLHGRLRPSFRAGETVTMLEGPFAGMEGIFAKEDGDKRAILLIELLGTTNRVRVGRDSFARAA